MKKIAITGVIGAGKSSVIAVLKDYKYTVLDCDRINDELLLKGNQGYEELVREFGNRILTSTKEIDRVKMSNHIFSNNERKETAEHILHPMIKAEIIKQLDEHKTEHLVFIEVPLLYEVRWESAFDEVWVIASDEERLLERLMKYREMDLQEAKRRLSHQISQDEKVKKADVVIWNNSNKESLKQQIYDILVRE